MAYNGSIELISGIKPKNNGDFPIVDAKDVRVTDGKRLDAVLEEKAEAADTIAKPAEEGETGQILRINEDGAPAWSNVGTPTEAQVGAAVDTWLAAHPEATTTVEDGAVSRAKLDDDLKAKTDAAPTLQTNAVQYRGVLDTTTVTPETVTEIGYWVASASTTAEFIGTIHSSVFFNLLYGATDFQQIFITSHGEIYCRNRKGIPFVSQSDFIRGVLDDPDTITEPGFYVSYGDVTNRYTGIIANCPFLNVTSNAGIVYYQAFFLPGGVIYSRNGNSGNFSAVFIPRRQTIFVPENPVVISTTVDENENEFVTVTIPTGRYLVPEYYLGINWITEPITITQTDAEVYQYGVFNLTSKTGRLVGRNETLAADDLVLFCCFRGVVTNIGIAASKFPQSDAITALQTNSVQYRGVLDMSTVTANSVSDIGYWTVPALATNALIGTEINSVFFNLKAPPNDYLQMIVTVKGEIYSRNGKSGSFVSQSDMLRGVLDDPDTTNAPGFYVSLASVTNRYTGTIVTCPFLNVATENGAVYYQAFFLPSGVIYSRNGNSGNFNAVSTPTKTINSFFAPMYNRTGTPFKIVLGGDSITWGARGTGATDDGDIIISLPSGDVRRNPNGYCWANLFKNYIESNYNAVVINNGVSSTYPQWWDFYKTLLIPNDTDLFILTLGTNQRFNNRPAVGETHDEQLDNYYTHMKSIIEYCHSQGIPIIICSAIPATAANEDFVDDQGVPRYLSHMYEYNGLNQRLAAEYHMEYFNLYNAMYYYCMDQGVDLSTLLADGFHPNDRGYRVMYYLYLKGFNLAPSYVPVELPQT